MHSFRLYGLFARTATAGMDGHGRGVSGEWQFLFGQRWEWVGKADFALFGKCRLFGCRVPALRWQSVGTLLAKHRHFVGKVWAVHCLDAGCSGTLNRALADQEPDSWKSRLNACFR